MQFPSVLIFGLLIQSAVAEPGSISQQAGQCPPGQVKCPSGSKPCNKGNLSRRDNGKLYCRKCFPFVVLPCILRSCYTKLSQKIEMDYQSVVSPNHY